MNHIQRPSRERKRGLGARNRSKSVHNVQTRNLHNKTGQTHKTHHNPNFVDKGQKVHIQMSPFNTIEANILGETVECLIDTGSLDINLVDYTWLTECVGVHNLKESHITSARVANGSMMSIKGFVPLSLVIKGCSFDDVMFGVVEDLSQTVIIGSKFLNDYGAKIDCAKRTVSLYKVSQLRVINKVDIPPHSQSIISAQCTRQLPMHITGVARGGRIVTSLGLMVANTVSMVLEDSYVNVLVMNVTDEAITLRPRTKLGNFTIIDPNYIEDFGYIDGTCSVNSVDVSNSHDSNDGHHVNEILTKVNIDSDQLSLKQQSDLNDLLSEFVDVFQVEGGPRGYYDGVKHEILTDHPPIRSRPYRQTPPVQAEVRRHVEQMLDQGIIRESTSPWSFPVCMIPKPGTNTYRFCIDYRMLNKVCARCNFSVPNINDTLDQLGAAKPRYFSTLDLAAGYWQIGLDENSKAKSAFITQDGLFEFNVLPFGLHNAPATFQRAMQEVFRGLHWQFVLIYLDDIIVFSNTFDEHLIHLRDVLNRLRTVGLKLQAKKCTFGSKQVKYLGHIVSADGIATDHDKVQIIRDYKIPAKVSEVRSFLGLVGYYRKFIKDFSKIAEPLTNLTRKDVPFVWTEDCKQAFELLKQKLLEPPILAYPQFDGTPFILQTDASLKGLGFVLAQVQGGKEKVISYGGRALSKAEKNYSITELEALAVVEGIKKYRPYLQHSVKFKIVTDHCALKWLFSGTHSGGRLARWSLQLQAYDFEVVHVKGKHNGNADALSRVNHDQNTCLHCKPMHKHPSVHSNATSDSFWIESNLDDISDDVIQDSMTNEPCPTVNVVRNMRFKHGKRIIPEKDTPPQVPHPFPDELDLAKFKRELSTDHFASSMLNYLTQDVLPPNSKEARDIVIQSDQYFERDGLLFNIWHSPAKQHMPERNVVRLYIPKTIVDTVLNSCHDQILAAHFGFQRTYDRIRHRYFWKGMHQDVDNWVRSCISCAQRKTHRHKVVAPMVTMKVPEPFQRVSVDVLGPLPISLSGNRYVLCFTDHCTRWPILVPLPETSAATVARAFFDHVICVHGCPETLLSDRGANFLSKIVLEVCRIMQTQKLNTSSYAPQTNAIQERFNSVILDTISHYVNECHTDWDTYLPAIQFAYRTTPATNSVGFSPFFLLYGREARLPLDVTLLRRCEYPEKSLRDHMHELIGQLEVFRAVSKTHAERNQSAMKTRYDDRAQEVDYQVGDTVWIYIPQLQKGLSRKLMKLWCGPYLLVQKTGPVNFRVRNLENNKLLVTPIHVNRMKFAYDRVVRPQNNEPPADTDQITDIPGLVTADCPDSSFEPLLGTQECDKSHDPIVPGLPVVQNPIIEYEVEKIIRGRYKGNRLEYLVKWKGYPNSRNTWEPVSNLNKATVEYLERNPVKISGCMKRTK